MLNIAQERAAGGLTALLTTMLTARRGLARERLRAVG
jgi:hypothetical protein